LSKYDLYFGKLCPDLLENFLTVDKERCRERHSPGLAPLFLISGTAIAQNGLPAAKDSSRCLIRQNVGTKTAWVQKCTYLHISIHLSRRNSMKKATITFITSAALAFAIPLYAADKPVKSDSEQQAEVTQQGFIGKSDPQQKAAGTQQGTQYDSEQKAGMTQDARMTQEGMKSDSEQNAGLTQQQTDQMPSGQMITADKLQGMEVVNQEGEELGEIQKITIDKQSGEVQFVTFTRGGILGMGAEEIAAPLSAFEIRDDQARLTVDQSKLENVPQKSADVTDSDYQRDLETHYGVAPAWEKGNMDNTPQTQKMGQDPSNQRKVDTQN